MTYPVEQPEEYIEWEFPEHTHEFVDAPGERANSGGIEYKLVYCIKCDVREFIPDN